MRRLPILLGNDVHLSVFYPFVFFVLKHKLMKLSFKKVLHSYSGSTKMTQRLLALALILSATSTQAHNAAIFQLANEFVIAQALPELLKRATQVPGFDIDVTNEQDKTALAVACEVGFWPNIIALLEYGANPLLASQSGHDEVNRFMDTYKEVVLTDGFNNTIENRREVIRILRSGGVVAVHDGSSRR